MTEQAFLHKTYLISLLADSCLKVVGCLRLSSTLQPMLQGKAIS